LPLTFDVDWSYITACLHDSPQEDWDICDYAFLENRIMLDIQIGSASCSGLKFHPFHPISLPPKQFNPVRAVARKKQIYEKKLSGPELTRRI
jgi:hypothetical protein